MSPQVEAAIIAASVGVLTLIATVVTQFLGRRATSRDTEKTLDRTLAQQREQLDTTLTAQSEQLDRTLVEQRGQLNRTLAEQRTRTLNERFATAAEQLGSDKRSAVRLAGVYAMAGLADDWEKNRQTCIDVLCAYLRLPYHHDPGHDALAEQLAYRRDREVRHTIIRVITAHLKWGAAVPWQGLNFDFTGVVFDGGSFASAEFSGGKVDFGGAEFSGGEVDFTWTKFSRGVVDFGGAKFSGGEVDFRHADVSAGTVDFGGAKFSGGKVNFSYAEFSGGKVDFSRTFSDGAEFSGGQVYFHFAKFSGGKVNFSSHYSGGVKFTGGTVDFSYAKFSGGKVDFRGAEFSGGQVKFGSPHDWSVPPEFPWTGTPPPGVTLPEKEDQSQA